MVYSESEQHLLSRLTEGFFAKTLSESELNHLADQLDASEEFRKWFCQQHEIDYWLRIAEQEKIRQEKELVDQPLEFDGAALDKLVELAALNPSIRRQETGEAPSKTKPLESLRPYQSKISWPPVMMVSVFILCLFGGLAYLEFFRTSTPIASKEEPLAKTTVSVGMQWPDQEERIKQGQSLATGRIRFSDGLFEMKFSNGVRLAMEGKSDFELISPQKIFCEQGHLSVFVPKGVERFEVETPFVNVVDLGTKFSLKVDDSGVETHVLEGRVELVRPLFGKAEWELEAGRAVRVSSQGTLHRMKTDDSLYLNDETLKQKVTAAATQAKDRGENIFERYRKDPALVLELVFEPSVRVYPNRAGAAVQLGSEGKLLSARPAAGSMPESFALEFTRPGDGVETNIPRTMQNLTLWASVCPESLDRFTQVLFSSRNLGPGSLLWQISGSGSLDLSIQHEAKSAGLKFISTPFFQDKHLGTWCQVACVIDSKEKKIVHYIDGRKWSESTLETIPPVRVGTATVGNSFISEKKPGNDRRNRSFGGRIERILLFDRVLSEEEISTLSEVFIY